MRDFMSGTSSCRNISKRSAISRTATSPRSIAGRTIGIGFKQTDAGGNVRLFWVKRRDLRRFGNAWQEKVIDALRRIAGTVHPVVSSIHSR